MIMHFNCMHRKRGHTNRHVNKMINTMITSNLAPSVNTAFGRLQHWSKMTQADFKKSDLTKHDDAVVLNMMMVVVLTRCFVDKPCQIETAKMNHSVAKVNEFVHEMQQSLNE